MVRKYIDKIKRNIDDYGFSVTAGKIFSGMSGIFVKRVAYRIYKKDLCSVSGTKPGFPDSSYSIRSITEYETDIIRQVENTAEWLRGKLSLMIRDGGKCFCVFKSECLVGFNIIGFGRIKIPLVEFGMTMKKTKAWSEHIAIEKESRQYGLASILRRYVFDWLRENGYKQLYGGCLPDNTASLCLARKMGFKEITDIRFCRILGVKKWKFERINR